MATIPLLIALELSGITGQLLLLLAVWGNVRRINVAVAQSLKQLDGKVFDGRFSQFGHC